MSWLRNLLCGPCPCEEEPALELGVVSREPTVSATSPARLIAKSMTDPETRGEWTCEFTRHVYSHETVYRNAARDISITRQFGVYLDSLSTPFTLSKAEEAVVLQGITDFNRYTSAEAERAALTRLTAEPAKPRKGKGA